MSYELGRERVLNWQRWALTDDTGLGYPKACAWAREYRPEAGDIWDDKPDDIDERAALETDERIRTLPIFLNRAVRFRYLYRLSIERIAKIELVSRGSIEGRLEQALMRIGI
jgi:DNA-directed RNA polymerase specialized sigma24 family protein